MKTVKILIILTLTLISTNGWTQISFFDSSENRTSIGALYSQQTTRLYFDDGDETMLIKVKQITGSLDYRLRKTTKLSLYPSLTFGKMDIEDTNLDFPPSPSLYIRVSSAHSLNDNQLGTFYIGEAGISFLQIVHNFDETAYSITASVGGGIGIYQKIKIGNPKLSITPSFSIYYHNVRYWIFTKTRLDDPITTKPISGQASLEIEISPTISVIGLSTFSFQNSESIFTIGVNFH